MQNRSFIWWGLLGALSLMFSPTIQADEWWDYASQIMQTNKNLTESQIDELVERNYPKCRNVVVAGPISTHFEDALLVTQMNNRSGFFVKPSQAIISEFNSMLKSGIHCRSNYPRGLNCSGIGYLDPVVGEVVRVNRSRYKRYGDMTESYVPVMIRWPGSNDFMLVHAEKRNARCSGRPEDPGVATGMSGVKNDRFIFW